MMKTRTVNAPVFVVGTARSGTTLTAGIIGRHSHIFMPAETHFFDDIYSRRQQLGNPSNPESMRRICARLSTLYRRQHEGQYQKKHADFFKDADKITQLMGPCIDYRDVFSRFMEIQMERTGKVRWGNQVPRDIFNISEILKFYPDARIVVCVRDLRDFLLSYSAMKNVVPSKHVMRQKSIYHPVVTGLLWRATVRYIQTIKQQVAPDHLLILRYEDLVSKPEVAARSICQLMEVDFEPQMLDVSDNNSSKGSGSDKTVGIFCTSVGRWQNNLPSEHVYIGQKIAGQELHKLGYEQVSVTVNPFKVMLIVLQFPIALMRGLYANRAKQASFLPYIFKRLGALLRNAGAA